MALSYRTNHHLDNARAGEETPRVDDTVFIGGPEKRAIVIEEYDPAWAARFEQVQAALQQALQTQAHRIEHFGSTAVPGLGAKGIIDVLVTVDDADDEAAYGPPLERAGFHIRVRQPGHRMYRTPDLDVHVHILTEGSDSARVRLLFRDWLRHDEVRPPALRGDQARARAPRLGRDERLQRGEGPGRRRDPRARASVG